MKVCAVGLLLIGCAFPAMGEERSTVVADCVAAFASGDTAKFEASVSIIRSWGEVTNPNLKRAADSCINLVPPSAAPFPDSPSTQTEALPQPVAKSPEEIARLSKVLATSIENRAFATAKALINELGERSTWGDDLTVSLEQAALSVVKPMPASDPTANAAGYELLALIQPDNATYTEKAASYRSAQDAAKTRIAKSLKKQTAEFDGSSWYRHPDSPRYQDTRPYVTLYVLESGSGQRSLEFFLNYTADSWLFVRSAQINIDGEIVSLPSASWSRDNDTEIWEWTGYRADERLLEVAQKIASSKRAVIRFNGQEFYDDYVVPQSDKNAIRDMLLAWEVMKNP
jgi:hypothetical protein